MDMSEWLKDGAQKLADEIAAVNEERFLKDSISGFGMKGRVIELIDELKAALFPMMYEDSLSDYKYVSIKVAKRLRTAGLMLHSILKDVLENKCEQEKREGCDGCEEQANSMVMAFFESLAKIRRILNTDIEAAYEGDPAAIYMDEILLSYPSIEAISIYRMAHRLFTLNAPLIPRVMTEHAHQLTGIDIHPGAKIGEHFFIDHGTGVVIGETCVIGNRVKLYQGVTLGAKSFELDEYGKPVKGVKRHPNIEDDVVIYAGATILGGSTTVGRGSVIGGNVWLVESVPPYSKVYNATPSPNILNN